MPASEFQARLAARRRAAGLPPDPHLPELPVQPLSELTPRGTDWLWPGRLPLGALAVLDGKKTAGKSTIAAAIAAAVTSGTRLPGRTSRSRISVLWVAGEEDLRCTVWPKLEVAGADLRRVWALGQDELRRHRLQLPADLDQLERTIVRTAASLVVIDPLSAAVSPAIVVMVPFVSTLRTRLLSLSAM